MKKLDCLLYLIFLLFARAHTQAADLEKTIVVDELERVYLLHLPPDYSSTSHHAVIFALHGGGGNYENTVSFYNLNALADQHGFIVVYPNAINKSWSMKGVGSLVKEAEEIDDVKFIATLMDTLVNNYHGDAPAFFCTGLSRGGIFALFLADRLPGRIKAIAPICASIPQSIVDDYHFDHPTAVLLINGTDDPLLPFEGGYSEISRSKKKQENRFISTHELVKKIKSLNSCPEISIAHHISNQEENDECTAVKITYDCHGTLFTYIKIIHGGHSWPGGPQYLPPAVIGKVCHDFKAEEEIINFFVAVR